MLSVKLIDESKKIELINLRFLGLINTDNNYLNIFYYDTWSTYLKKKTLKKLKTYSKISTVIFKNNPSIFNKNTRLVFILKKNNKQFLFFTSVIIELDYFYEVCIANYNKIVTRFKTIDNKKIEITETNPLLK